MAIPRCPVLCWRLGRHPDCVPEFDLVPFAADQGEPANPYLQTVMRRPLSAAERPIPVGVVSHTYSLAPHRTESPLGPQGADVDGKSKI
jgi:hypothetical protein